LDCGCCNGCWSKAAVADLAEMMLPHRSQASAGRTRKPDRKMLTYRFTIDGDFSPTEEMSATLPDDDAAWDYGESIIRGLLNSDRDAEESRVMVIARGGQMIGSIAFNLSALRSPRNLQ
jgi:hypothetical protein